MAGERLYPKQENVSQYLLDRCVSSSDLLLSVHPFAPGRSAPFSVTKRYYIDTLRLAAAFSQIGGKIFELKPTGSETLTEEFQKCKILPPKKN